MYRLNIIKNTTAVRFANIEETKNKNPDDENADLFSILGQLENYRTCSGQLHFKLCWPELAEEYSFPCNEWTQRTNPAESIMTRGYTPVRITFDPENFRGLAKDNSGVGCNLMDYRPYVGNWWFSVGTLCPFGVDSIPGPPPRPVYQVEMFVNPGGYPYGSG